MAASVPTMVNAPTSASSRLSTAKPLVRVGGGTGGSATIGLWQSGHGIDWPANLSSISNRAPQEQVTAMGMGKCFPEATGARRANEGRPRRRVGLPFHPLRDHFLAYCIIRKILRKLSPPAHPGAAA